MLDIKRKFTIVVVWLLVVVGLVCNVNVLADKGSVGISHVEIPI